MTKLDQLEVTIEQAQEAIKNMDALKQLEKHKAFKRIISEGFFKDEASRMVLLKADPSMASPEMQESLDNGIIACGHFRQYLSGIYQLGNAAVRSLAADEVTREELLAEEA